MCFIWQNQLVTALEILRLLDENGHARVGSYSRNWNTIGFENEPGSRKNCLGTQSREQDNVSRVLIYMFYICTRCTI